MTPERWFLDALKVIDPALGMSWDQRSCKFLITEARGPRKARIVCSIDPSEQVEMTLEGLRRGDTWSDGRVEEYLKEQQRLRDQKFQGRFDSYRADESERGNEIVAKMAGIRSTVVNPEQYARDALRAAVRDAGASDHRELLEAQPAR